METVQLNLNFAGAILPIAQDDDGNNVVPLKPIVELFGLEWVRQHKRVTSGWLKVFLGTCVVHMYYAGQSRGMVCIRLDKVIAFMAQINPDSVRAAGNEKGADFLIEKWQQWATVLHDFEEQNGTLATNMEKESRSRRVHVLNLKDLRTLKGNASEKKERVMLDSLIAIEAQALGVEYQPDMLDIGEK